MIITVTGKHIEITDAIRSHAEDKAEKLSRFYDLISQIEVLIEGNSGARQFVEVIVHAEHYDMLVAKEEGPDLYTCIDAAVHKIERQLKKAKEKQRTHKAVPIGEFEAPLEEDQEGVASPD